MDQHKDKKPPLARQSSRDKKPTIEDILKRAVEDMAVGQRREKSPSIVKTAGKPGDDLMTSLLKRVSVLEKLNENYKIELREKSLKVSELEEKVDVMKKLSEPGEVDLVTALKVRADEQGRKQDFETRTGRHQIVFEGLWSSLERAKRQF